MGGETPQEVEWLEQTLLVDSVRVNGSAAFRHHYLFGGVPISFASSLRRLSDGR
jgi:hypothetical protein